MFQPLKIFSHGVIYHRSFCHSLSMKGCQRELIYQFQELQYKILEMGLVLNNCYSKRLEAIHQSCTDEEPIIIYHHRNYIQQKILPVFRQSRQCAKCSHLSGLVPYDTLLRHNTEPQNKSIRQYLRVSFTQVTGLCSQSAIMLHVNFMSISR